MGPEPIVIDGVTNGHYKLAENQGVSLGLSPVQVELEPDLQPVGAQPVNLQPAASQSLLNLDSFEVNFYLYMVNHQGGPLPVTRRVTPPLAGVENPSYLFIRPSYRGYLSIYYE